MVANHVNFFGKLKFAMGKGPSAPDYAVTIAHFLLLFIFWYFLFFLHFLSIYANTNRHLTRCHFFKKVWRLQIVLFLHFLSNKLTWLFRVWFELFLNHACMLLSIDEDKKIRRKFRPSEIWKKILVTNFQIY